jgi:hypothetical protein
MADFGLSAFAMFFIQSASFLSFSAQAGERPEPSNRQTLFGIEKIPSDNYIRDMLDVADPEEIEHCAQFLPAFRRRAAALLGADNLAADSP